MNISIKPFAIMLLAACVATGVAQAGDDWPEFPVPDELEVNWQSDNMVVNGMPMHIVEFRCDCPAEHVLEYYRRRWRDAKPVGYVEQPMGEWQQINYGNYRYFYSVMVQDHPVEDDQSLGRLSLTVVPTKDPGPIELGAQVPKLGRTTVMSDIFDKIDHRDSRVVTMHNSLDVDENSRFYQDHFQRGGWRSFLVPLAPGKGAQALSYKRGREEVNLTIHWNRGRSFILYNHVEENLF